ncbi:hypothetical protein IEQ34_009389 [Dendrobium chrysotoxum]|uniref:RING-type E3 ubiquitin transferase n=1 Tax=Dendrobium chrysotoxum TaxID=161865 RepID=A0AAV7H183_DENCH|nr:hypothetical protein IEQ34_009389 [Dendrobium chrysotoxum]
MESRFWVQQRLDDTLLLEYSYVPTGYIYTPWMLSVATPLMMRSLSTPWMIMCYVPTPWMMRSVPAPLMTRSVPTPRMMLSIPTPRRMHSVSNPSYRRRYGYEVLSRLRSQNTNHTRMHSATIDTDEMEPEQQNPQYQSSRAGSRLSQECISNFLINSLGRLTNTEENIICTICQEDINVKEEIATLCCSHIYHAGCIEKWLMIKNECAVCRSAVILDEVGGRDPH